LHIAQHIMAAGQFIIADDQRSGRNQTVVPFHPLFQTTAFVIHGHLRAVFTPTLGERQAIVERLTQQDGIN